MVTRLRSCRQVSPLESPFLSFPHGAVEGGRGAQPTRGGGGGAAPSLGGRASAEAVRNSLRGDWPLLPRLFIVSHSSRSAWTVGVDFTH